MKKVKLTELENQALFVEQEGFSVENQGKIVGVYYPVIDHQKVKQAKEEMDLVMEKVLQEIGLNEEEYIEFFINVTEE